MKERHPQAMFVVSGYTMDIHCQYCMVHKEIAFDGVNCYRDSRKNAKLNGWTLHKDGFATCKDCKQKT